MAGRHLRFVPRQAEALELVSRCAPGGMIDLSDGLSIDTWHLARESGVRIRLRAADIPLSPAAAGAEDDRPALTHALDDGEDFELLFTASPEDAASLVADGLAGTPVTRIGEVLEGAPEVTIVGADGQEAPLVEGGYEHFR
jgi:thiamine-monophosphate kinase